MAGKTPPIDRKPLLPLAESPQKNRKKPGHWLGKRVLKKMHLPRLLPKKTKPAPRRPVITLAQRHIAPLITPAKPTLAPRPSPGWQTTLSGKPVDQIFPPDFNATVRLPATQQLLALLADSSDTEHKIKTIKAMAEQVQVFIDRQAEALDIPALSLPAREFKVTLESPLLKLQALDSDPLAGEKRQQALEQLALFLFDSTLAAMDSTVKSTEAEDAALENRQQLRALAQSLKAWHCDISGSAPKQQAALKLLQTYAQLADRFLKGEDVKDGIQALSRTLDQTHQAQMQLNQIKSSYPQTRLRSEKDRQNIESLEQAIFEQAGQCDFESLASCNEALKVASGFRGATAVNIAQQLINSPPAQRKTLIERIQLPPQTEQKSNLNKRQDDS